MASELLHADDTPIRVLDRSRKDKGLGKGVKQGRIWTYVRDQRPWAVRTRRARSTTSRPTERANIPESTWPAAAVSFKPTPIPASRNYTSGGPMAPRSSVRQRAGRICAAISTTSGHPPDPKSRRRPWTGSASSTTSSARSPASPPRFGAPFGRRRASRWSRRSAPGPSASSRAFPARATLPRPSAMAWAGGTPSACSSTTGA